MRLLLSGAAFVTLDRAAAPRSAGPFAGSRSRGWRLLALFVPPTRCDALDGQDVQLFLRTYSHSGN